MVMAILHFSREGDLVIPGQEPIIGTGVRGIAFDCDDGVHVPLIVAEHQGNGDVGRWPEDRRVVFPAVISARLRGMLKRRGFRPIGDDNWERPARLPEL